MIRLLKALFAKKQEIEKPICDLFEQYPHEIFPEILKWEKQDKIIDYNKRFELYFLRIKGNGDCLFRQCGEPLTIINVKKLKDNKRYWNYSLNERKEAEQDSKLMKDFWEDDYEQFCSDFQKAYREAKQ